MQYSTYCDQELNPYDGKWSYFYAFEDGDVDLWDYSDGDGVFLMGFDDGSDVYAIEVRFFDLYD
ncbi:MAG: hypothetical protein ACOY3Y_03405 [Acidobacteriota bacterium]